MIRRPPSSPPFPSPPLSRSRRPGVPGSPAGRRFLVADREREAAAPRLDGERVGERDRLHHGGDLVIAVVPPRDRKSTRLNSSHLVISYAVFCLKKKTTRPGR